MNSRQPVLAYVDDDENSIFVMKMVVERVMGLPTLYVLQSRADFVEQVKELGLVPDVFLLDLQMKPYDGVELLSMLRGDPQFKKSKVIALTASVTNEEVSLLKGGGFDGAIAKPLNIDVFPDLIAKVINGEHIWYIACGHDSCGWFPRRRMYPGLGDGGPAEWGSASAARRSLLKVLGLMFQA